MRRDPPFLLSGEITRVRVDIDRVRVRARIFDYNLPGNFKCSILDLEVRTRRRIAFGEETRTRMTVRDTESRVAVSPVLPLPWTAYPLRPFRRFAPPWSENAYSNRLVRLDPRVSPLWEDVPSNSIAPLRNLGLERP